jgi:restriction endonuclease S subunit
MATEKIDLNNLDKSDWKTYRFDEIAQNISERVDPNNTELEVYIGLEHIDSESLHIKRHGTPDDVNGTKLKFCKDDIIFGRRRAYQRKAGIATCDGFCSAHALVLRANPDVINPELFPFFMHSDLFMNRAVDISVGSLSPTINWGTLKHQEFLIPSIEQQKYFAELLSKKEIHSGNSNYLLEKLKTAKNSMIKNYISQSTKNKRVRDLGVVLTGSTPSTSVDDYWGGRIPFITPGDIDDSPTVNKPERFVTESGLAKSRKFPKGSIMTVCIGSTIGKVSLSVKESCCNQQINVLIPKKKYGSIYLLYLFRYFKHKILARSGATAVPIINKSEFELISLPILENELILQFESDVIKFDNAIADLQRKITSDILLKNSIINQVF